MRDNMLNSTFDMENRPRDIGDLNRRIPGLTNYEQGIKDVFDRLEGLCITPPAHRSLCMFRNSYARKNGMRFLERPLPPLPRSPGDRPSQSSEEQPVQRERRFSLLGRMARKGRKVSGDEQREMQA
ncbi:hypothetical protein EJ06DRAFT_99945 [Trichodelitschia bisporula]|uniref:Uncharacterized protein n=1 Tax=Trichodelitschia bisporula TaxID=703511 RepID=A0A6G1HR46_9PEZI|nr:hypothetical protein EJ06DRAFT_99945 [Trichodelitschia bisporula]